TAKLSPGRCLDVMYRYTRRNDDPNGNVGDASFIGEHTLQPHYRVEMDKNGELVNAGLTGEVDKIDTSSRVITLASKQVCPGGDDGC
ncbi:hypothetical protein PHMEG_00021299, partial [Phytophthora megakarya]